MLRLLRATTAVAMIAGAPMAWADPGGMDMKGMRASDRSTVSSDMKGMNMPMSDQTAHFEPTHDAFATNDAFLVKVVSLPGAIPFQKFFSVSLSVFDGKHTDQNLRDATVDVNAGMRECDTAGKRDLPTACTTRPGSRPRTALSRSRACFFT
jgi:hypothetical protein